MEKKFNNVSDKDHKFNIIKKYFKNMFLLIIKQIIKIIFLY